MLPIIGAAARAASAAGKAARAASAAGKASRAAKASDEIYNARRRYARKANRYLQQADNSYGAARERYMSLARQETEKALATYEKEPSFNDMSKALREAQARTNARFVEPSNDARRAELVSKSRMSLESSITERREYEGRKIMSSSVGSRIIGALEPIWREYATVTDEGKTKIDWSQAAPAIFDYMSEVTGKPVNDWLGVIEAFEANPEIGGDLYKDPKNELRYDDVVQAAQRAFKL